MKLYETTTIQIRNGGEHGDEFEEYLGTSEEQAVKAGENAWLAMATYDQKHSKVEVRAYDIADDIDLDDKDAVYEAMCELCGYDTVAEFYYGFKEKLREELDYSELTQREFAGRLGVPLNTLETWLRGSRCPDQFKSEVLLIKASKIAEEARNED